MEAWERGQGIKLARECVRILFAGTSLEKLHAIITRGHLRRSRIGKVHHGAINGVRLKRCPVRKVRGDFHDHDLSVNTTDIESELVGVA